MTAPAEDQAAKPTFPQPSTQAGKIVRAFLNTMPDRATQDARSVLFAEAGKLSRGVAPGGAEQVLLLLGKSEDRRTKAAMRGASPVSLSAAALALTCWAIETRHLRINAEDSWHTLPSALHSKLTDDTIGRAIERTLKVLSRVTPQQLRAELFRASRLTQSIRVRYNHAILADVSEMILSGVRAEQAKARLRIAQEGSSGDPQLF